MGGRLHYPPTTLPHHTSPSPGPGRWERHGLLSQQGILVKYQMVMEDWNRLPYDSVGDRCDFYLSTSPQRFVGVCVSMKVCLSVCVRVSLCTCVCVRVFQCVCMCMWGGGGGTTPSGGVGDPAFLAPGSNSPGGLTPVNPLFAVSRCTMLTGPSLGHFAWGQGGF